MLALDSKISAVTVYRRGAVVTREVDFRQPEEGWPQQVRLGGLPLALADQSLRVRLSFPEGGAGLLATDLRLELDWQEPEPVPAPDLSAIKPLQAEQRRLCSRLENLKQDLARVENLNPTAPSSPSDQAPAAYAVQPRRALVQMRQKLLSEGLARRSQLAEELERVTTRLQELTTPLPSPPPAPLYKAVVVTLRQTPDAHCPLVRLHLSYEQAGARWSPSYTLRFDRDFTLAELSMQAHLCQSTGEDWKDVRLEVSTAEVAAWKELPELASRRIGRQQARPAKSGWRPAPPNTDTLFADFDRRPTVQVRPEEPPSWGGDPFAQPVPQTEVLDELLGAPDPFAAAAVAAFAASAEPSIQVDLRSPEDRGETMLRSGLMRRQAKAEPEMMRMRAPAPAPVMAAPMRPQAMAPRGGGGRPAGPAWQPVAPPPPPEPTSEQLAYGLLYMAGAKEPGRGHLQLRSPLEACLQLWKERYPHSPLDVLRLVQNALHESVRALQVNAPARHTFPKDLEGFDYLYSGEHNIDLPGDAQFHSVPLLTRQLSAHLLWLVVPKVTCDVFRQTSLESMPDLAVPTGPVDVYVGNDFLATTQLPNVAPGGNFSLGLGVDQSIKVVRNTGFKESTTGMMSSTTQLRQEVTVEAANQLSREVRLEIQETLPQTDAAEIKVKIESCEPAWDPISEKPGVYRWVLRIPAGESKRASLAYSIEMPAKLELVGGNRREE
ncbi:hypothetical protein ABS71_11130 [bacterium SCN 62-11]|nr:DUF4139 domain-containing protein [Candidatus Eremiobacteraeota bacterium]ODT67264.1 MAG: hypothetical protein ABS71_11130 [bacterium SCN 62-11]